MPAPQWLMDVRFVQWAAGEKKNGMCHRAPPQAKALKKRKYGSLAAFRADVALLIANAHAFNEVRDDVSSKDLGS